MPRRERAEQSRAVVGTGLEGLLEKANCETCWNITMTNGKVAKAVWAKANHA